MSAADEAKPKKKKAPSELVGLAHCPLCSSSKARVTLSSRGLCVLTCNACNCQMFARSDHSDGHIRRCLVDKPKADITAGAVLMGALPTAAGGTGGETPVQKPAPARNPWEMF